MLLADFGVPSIDEVPKKAGKPQLPCRKGLSGRGRGVTYKKLNFDPQTRYVNIYLLPFLCLKCLFVRVFLDLLQSTQISEKKRIEK
jgi:hypothetical protein